jgi:hypothetical protein
MMTALQERFSAGVAPRPADLDGDHRGRLLTGPAWRLAGALWVGKRFYHGCRGHNLVGLPGWTVAIAPFRVASAASPLDGSERCTLLYGGWGVRDELVLLPDGSLLGRGYLARGRPLLWFTLRRAARC